MDDGRTDPETPMRLPRKVDELPPLTARDLRRFLAYVKPQLGFAVPMVVFMGLGIASGVPLPLIPMWVLDEAVKRGDKKLLLGLVLLSAGLALAGAIARLLQQYFQVRFRQGLAYALRGDLLRHFLSLSPAFFDDEDTGYLMSRTVGDAAQVESLLSTQILTPVIDAAKFLGGVAILFWLHWKLALVSATVIPFFFLAIVLFRRPVRAASNDVMESMGALFKSLHEAFSGISLVKALGRGASEAGRVLSRLSDLFGVERRSVILSASSSALVSFVTALGMAAVLGFGALEIMEGRFTVGKLVAFLGYLGYLYGPSRSLASLPVRLQPALVSMRRILGVHALPPEPSGNLAPDALRGDVRLAGVRFAYRPGDEVLRGVDLDVSAGERVGIAGETGSGKSTLLKILLGLYAPQAGRVRIDGRPVGAYDASALRARTGYLPQDAFFFSDTVFGNLAWAAPGASREEIEGALETAEALGFVRSLPAGLDTLIGERGQKLSGGEKQRLAVARALLRKPDLLVMDEGTSELDEACEARLLASLLEAFRDRTVILVSHRPSALRQTDRIVRVEQGRIVADGKPEGLSREG